MLGDFFYPKFCKIKQACGDFINKIFIKKFVIITIYHSY